MDLFAFFRIILLAVIVVTAVWPVNVPLMALAYKVRLGTQPVPLEPGEFWTRAAFAALGLALLSAVTLGLNYVLVVMAGVPAEPVPLVLFLLYLPAAAAYLFWMFALEEPFEALSLCVLYLFLPGIPLLLIDRVFGFWQPLTAAAGWLPLSP